MPRSLKDNAQEVLMLLSMEIRAFLHRAQHVVHSSAIPIDRGFTADIDGLGRVVFFFEIDDRAMRLVGIGYSERGHLEVVGHPHPVWQGGNKIVDACFDAARGGIDAVMLKWK